MLINYKAKFYMLFVIFFIKLFYEVLFGAELLKACVINGGLHNATQAGVSACKVSIY